MIEKKSEFIDIIVHDGPAPTRYLSLSKKMMRRFFILVPLTCIFIFAFLIFLLWWKGFTLPQLIPVPKLPSVEELKIHDVILAPNPTNGNMNVTFSSLTWTPITIKVYDISGRIIKQLSPIKVLGQHTINLDLKDIQTGIYQLVIDNGTFNSYRFMKN
jgi:hypothetical protein